MQRQLDDLSFGMQSSSDSDCDLVDTAPPGLENLPGESNQTNWLAWGLKGAIIFTCSPATYVDA